MIEGLPDFKAGLRCHDVHAGLRNVDPNSATLAPLSDTRMVGMAASLASLVRGQDVVSDAEALKTIVAEQLDINPYAFGPVVETLERAGMVDDVKRRGQKILSSSVMSSVSGDRDSDVMVCDLDMSSTRWLEVGS